MTELDGVSYPKPAVESFTPTAENVVTYIFHELNGRFSDVFNTGLRLHSVKLWETPSSYALYERGQE